MNIEKTNSTDPVQHRQIQPNKTKQLQKDWKNIFRVKQPFNVFTKSRFILTAQADTNKHNFH